MRGSITAGVNVFGKFIQSVKFKYESNEVVKKFLEDFKEMVNLCLDAAVKNRATSLAKLHHLVYQDLKQRFNYHFTILYLSHKGGPINTEVVEKERERANLKEASNKV
ncbi:MAG: hypothetical protein QW323_00815 [Candidatus Bathyarchaeia archaeon]